MNPVLREREANVHSKNHNLYCMCIERVRPNSGLVDWVEWTQLERFWPNSLNEDESSPKQFTIIIIIKKSSQNIIFIFTIIVCLYGYSTAVTAIDCIFLCIQTLFDSLLLTFVCTKQFESQLLVNTDCLNVTIEEYREKVRKMCGRM